MTVRDNLDQPDLVDVFYHPYVRALGNLVILFAQSEAELVDLIMLMKGVDEKDARAILKMGDAAKRQIISLIEKTKLEPSIIRSLIDTVEKYWANKERRNRYMHDEWYPGLNEKGVPGTRGLPQKKGAEVVWDRPTPRAVWLLALQFREHGRAFSHAAYTLRQARDAQAEAVTHD